MLLLYNFDVAEQYKIPTYFADENLSFYFIEQDLFYLQKMIHVHVHLNDSTDCKKNPLADMRISTL